jgi:hypothetical protein
MTSQPADEQLTSGQAVVQSIKDLQHVKSKRPEVERISRSLRKMREQNHFGELLVETMRRGGVS